MEMFRHAQRRFCNWGETLEGVMTWMRTKMRQNQSCDRTRKVWECGRSAVNQLDEVQWNLLRVNNFCVYWHVVFLKNLDTAQKLEGPDVCVCVCARARFSACDFLSHSGIKVTPSSLSALTYLPFSLPLFPVLHFSLYSFGLIVAANLKIIWPPLCTRNEDSAA